MKRKIAIIGCGGTISTIATNPTDFIDYPETGRKIEVNEVVERMGELLTFVDIEAIPFRAVGSSAIGPAEWIEMCHIIDRLSMDRTDISGVVILHGTATLEETAYFLNLALKTALPVVLVGAQRPFNATGSDAQVNLISAIRTLLEPAAAGNGVLVVLNDEIHQARDVSKGSTYRLHAFRSAETGPLGTVDADRVTIFRNAVRPAMDSTPFDAPAFVTDLPRVDITYAYAGSDAAVVDAFCAAGASGIISAGFAPGMPSIKERAALEAASARGVMVVQASRVGSGRVAERSYLKQQGWIAANDLTPHKARILLMLALTVTRDRDEIQSFFEIY
ncbi:MAG: hypothetical protein VR78_13340 [Hoeflea sp. BRH_c9]|nr:MAG: hypothetical protein VR78_13340 [Hoeflea sp. BRH_c9]